MIKVKQLIIYKMFLWLA